MNTSAKSLLPLVTASFLFASCGTLALADDGGIPVPSRDRSEAAKSFNVMFTPVPYRRAVQSQRPVVVSSFTRTQTRHDVENRSQNTPLHTGTIEFLKQAVLGRVAEHKAGQNSDLLVPEPQDLEVTNAPARRASSASLSSGSSTYRSSKSIRKREPVNFYSTAGVRAFH